MFILKVNLTCAYTGVVRNGSGERADKTLDSRMTLEDKLWKNLQGGYGTNYDASIPLKQLEGATDKAKIGKILEELWDELHHQGDVGLASYLAVPQLVRIGRDKGLFDWNLLGLCSVIEQQRHLGNNPPLPTEFKNYYENGLARLKQFIISNITRELDKETLRTALSALATCTGQIKLGKAILELDDDVLEEFLNNSDRD